MTRLIVGLGNPGPEYRWTRHNVGFHVLERLAERRGGLFRSARHLEGYGGPRAFDWCRIEGPDGFLLCPGAWMNRSGQIVAPVARFLELASEDLLVVYDDLDLELGRLRIRPHGSSGGHRGMRSIIEHLATDRFPRLRVGIGRKGTDAARYVLQPFPAEERVEAEISVAEAAEAILDWLASGDIQGCMTRFHSRWNQES